MKTHGDALVGQRLDEEITRVFGSKKLAAEKMGLKDSSYYTTYIRGRNKIGGILQKKLMDAGLDVEYILHGKRVLAAVAASEASDIERLRVRMKAMSEELEDMAEIMDKLAKKNSGQQP